MLIRNILLITKNGLDHMMLGLKKGIFGFLDRK